MIDEFYDDPQPEEYWLWVEEITGEVKMYVKVAGIPILIVIASIAFDRWISRK